MVADSHGYHHEFHLDACMRACQLQGRLLLASASLGIRCLSFDFVGSAPDESTEEVRMRLDLRNCARA